MSTYYRSAPFGASVSVRHLVHSDRQKSYDDRLSLAADLCEGEISIRRTTARLAAELLQVRLADIRELRRFRRRSKQWLDDTPLAPAEMADVEVVNGDLNGHHGGGDHNGGNHGAVL